MSMAITVLIMATAIIYHDYQLSPNYHYHYHGSSYSLQLARLLQLAIMAAALHYVMYYYGSHHDAHISY